MPQSFTQSELTALPYVISQPRFSTYLRSENNDQRRALALYRWNVQISAAFFVPLQVCEIAVRNGVVEVLETAHGTNWPWSRGFELSLPPLRTSYFGYQSIKDLTQSRQGIQTAGQVVAELKFVFWQNLFTVGQDPRLWDLHLQKAFPGIPAGSAVPTERAAIYGDIGAVRKFRNRIAHHEPIFARNIADEYSRLIRLISRRSPDAAAWVDRIQEVTAINAARP